MLAGASNQTDESPATGRYWFGVLICWARGAAPAPGFAPIRALAHVLAQDLDHQHPGVEDNGDQTGDVARRDPKEPGAGARDQESAADAEGQAEAGAGREAQNPLDRGHLLAVAPGSDLDQDWRDDHNKANREDLASDKQRGLFGQQNHARRRDRAHGRNQRLGRPARQTGKGKDARQVDRDRDDDEAGQRGERPEFGHEEIGPFGRQRQRRTSRGDAPFLKKDSQASQRFAESSRYGHAGATGRAGSGGLACWLGLQSLMLEGVAR